MTAPYKDFARRLHEALDLAGFEQGRARTGALSRAYGVSRETARKWLNGLALPELERMMSLAVDHNVSFEWLATGRGPVRGGALAVRDAPPSYVDRDEVALLGAFRQMPPKRRRALVEFMTG